MATQKFFRLDLNYKYAKLKWAVKNRHLVFFINLELYSKFKVSKFLIKVEVNY